MMGLGGITPMPGRDLLALAPGVRGRAILQFNATQAYLERDELVVLRHDLPPAGFRRVAGALEPIEVPRPELVDKAVAHATWAADAYRNARYGASPGTSPIVSPPLAAKVGHAPP